MEEESGEEVFIPQVRGVNLGISYFASNGEPMIVMDMVAAADDGDHMHLYAAFNPSDLQGLVPEIVDAVIRARTLMEMVTTWPEQRDEILENLSFRWTGQLVEEEDGDSGSPT